MQATAEGGKGGGLPPSSLRPQRAAGAQGGTPDHNNTGPPCDRAQDKEDEEWAPKLHQRAQAARGQEGAGDRPHTPIARSLSLNEEGDPPKVSVRSQRTACLSRGGDSPIQEEEEGAPPEQCALPAHVMQ